MPHSQKRFLISTCTLGLAAMTLSFHAQSQTTPSPSPSVSSSPSVVGDQRQVFTAQLNPLNVAYNASGLAATGTVTIVVDGTNFGVYSTQQGLDPNVVHVAYIHANNACPTANSDTNGDGVTDALETNVVSGAPIIPLDFSLNTYTTDLARALVSGGSTLFPTADSTGALTYIGSGTLSTVQAEAFRTNPTQNGTAESQWDPAQWSVVVSGVDTSVTLPSTVQAATGLTANESLPVACGVVVQQSGPTPSAAPSPSASASASPSPTASATPSPSATATASAAQQ